MAKAKHIPRRLLKVITDRGKKVWRADLAKRVEDPVLTHYALACNSLAEYIHTKDLLAAMEERGEDTYVTHNNNGTVGVHPLRLLMEKYRKAFSDEAKRCGLTVETIEERPDKGDDNPFEGLDD